MSLWGRSAEKVTASGGASAATTTNGQPLYTAGGVNVKGAQLGQVMGANSHYGNTSAGSRANVDVNLFCNATPSAFINNQSIGIFPVTPLEMAINRANNYPDKPAHAGWNLRRAGMGGIASATIAAGTNFVNGETVIVSNGTANAILSLTTNAAGVPTPSGVTVINPGAGWVNTTMAASTFSREKHLSTVTFSTGAGDVGYSNTSIITFSNASAYVNAYTANLSTNATGGTVTTTIAEKGRFLNALVATDLVMTITKYDGTTATGNTVTTAITKAVATSSAGTITLTLGGRAGRVHTETLVAMGSLGMSNAATGPNSASFVLGTTVNDPHYPN